MPKPIVPKLELRPDRHAPTRKGDKDHGLPAMDEIVAEGAYIHIERMSNDHVWAIVNAGGKEVRLGFWSDKGPIHFGAEETP